MSSTWRRAMLYLGLGPDEEYDDYDAHDERYQQPAPAMGSGVGQPVPVRRVQPVVPEPRHGVAPMDPHLDESVSAIRPIPNDVPMAGSAPAPAPSGAMGGVTPLDPGGSAVRAIPAVAKAKPHVVSPRSFTDAQDVADRFKGNQPVIVNLQGADRDLARRLIDFASGLCYGLGGQMERVADQVYLLTPSDVEVSDEERRRLQERGLHDS